MFGNESVNAVSDGFDNTTAFRPYKYADTRENQAMNSELAAELDFYPPLNVVNYAEVIR